VEGVGEEHVAEEDADLVPPPGVDRGNVPPQFRLVEHVVVNERRGVDHLDRGREGVVRRGDFPQRLCKKEQERWAEPLAAIVPEVLDQAAEGRPVLRERAVEGAVGFLDVARDRGERKAGRFVWRGFG
jgi:hypothetical protein